MLNYLFYSRPTTAKFTQNTFLMLRFKENHETITRLSISQMFHLQNLKIIINFAGDKGWLALVKNPDDEFRWGPEGSVSQFYSPHFLAGVPGIFSDLFRCWSESGVRKATGSYRTYSSLVKLQPRFLRLRMKPLEITLMMMMMMMMMIIITN